MRPLRLLEVLEAVRASLSLELLREPWRSRVLRGADPMTGQCYVASEALFHLLGGPSGEYKPAFVRHEGGPHWFLVSDKSGDVLDATASQFESVAPYELAVRKGFLTREPSRRARVVMKRALDRLRVTSGPSP